MSDHGYGPHSSGGEVFIEGEQCYWDTTPPQPLYTQEQVNAMQAEAEATISALRAQVDDLIRPIVQEADAAVALIQADHGGKVDDREYASEVYGSAFYYGNLTEEEWINSLVGQYARVRADERERCAMFPQEIEEPRDPLAVAAEQVEQCKRNAAFDRWQRDNGWGPPEQEPRPRPWWKRWWEAVRDA